MMNIRLSDVPRPGPFHCVDICCDGDASIQLKRLGVCQGRTVEVLQPGDPMVLRVVGARIGVSRRLAQCVLVQPQPRVSALVTAGPTNEFRGEPTLNVDGRFDAAEAVGHV